MAVDAYFKIAGKIVPIYASAESEQERLFLYPFSNTVLPPFSSFWTYNAWNESLSLHCFQLLGWIYFGKYMIFNFFWIVHVPLWNLFCIET